MNITFFDLETTDKEPMGNQILTAYFYTVAFPGFQKVDECYLEFKPEKYRVESFAIHGISEKRAKSFPDRWESFHQLLKYMMKWKDSYFCCHANYSMFGISGYFDKQVISAVCFERSYELYTWFEKMKFKVMSTHTIAKDKLSLSNYRQTTIAEYYGINYNAHDAKEDVLAMFKIFKKMNITKKEIEYYGNYKREKYSAAGEGIGVMQEYYKELDQE